MSNTLLERSLSVRNVTQDNILRVMNDQLIPVVRRIRSVMRKQMWLPVGVIIPLAVDTDANDLFGYGTWVEVGQGKVLVGRDTTDSDFATTGGTSGSKLHGHEYTHTHGYTHTHEYPHTHGYAHTHGHGHTHEHDHVHSLYSTHYHTIAQHDHTISHKHASPIGDTGSAYKILWLGAASSPTTYSIVATLSTSSDSGVNTAFMTSDSDTANTGTGGPTATGTGSNQNTLGANGTTTTSQSTSTTSSQSTSTTSSQSTSTTASQSSSTTDSQSTTTTADGSSLQPGLTVRYWQRTA